VDSRGINLPRDTKFIGLLLDRSRGIPNKTAANEHFNRLWRAFRRSPKHRFAVIAGQPVAGGLAVGGLARTEDEALQLIDLILETLQIVADRGHEFSTLWLIFAPPPFEDRARAHLIEKMPSYGNA